MKLYKSYQFGWQIGDVADFGTPNYLKALNLI
jgi:hypothetical protein